MVFLEEALKKQGFCVPRKIAERVTIQECNKQAVQPDGSNNTEIPSEGFGKQDESIFYIYTCVCMYMYI